MQSKRVLVVDDEESIQKVVRLSLKLEANWDIITASSGRDGILQAEMHQPDAILLDVMMPEIDGIATFEALHKNPKTQRIPVILLTAKTQTAEKRLFQKIGVAGVITKPFNSLTLASQIAKLLDWSIQRT
ncbi:MAG: response regulator [Leptolyngbya sp. SIO4C1]|nr:response regulator [Leptolyngbya sp. SIO4C1]